MRDYTRIEAWRLADNLTVAIYACTRTFPRDERYSLTGQVRRAAYSVPANIAEGSARATQKDYLHFLYIARGSLSEVHYFIHLAHRLAYLDHSEHNQLMEQTKITFGCLNGLIQAVARQV